MTEVVNLNALSNGFFLYFLGEGGDLTLFMTGRKLRPGTEPMYSGGNRDDFPITIGYDSVKYKDFVSSHLFNSENILVCQSLHPLNGTVLDPSFTWQFDLTITPSLSCSMRTGEG